MSKEKYSLYIYGVCKGYACTPWSTDHTKFNHTIGMARMYEDKYGEAKEDAQDLNLYNDQSTIDRISKQAKAAQGKFVRIAVFVSAQPGRSGPWLKYVVPKDASIEVMEG